MGIVRRSTMLIAVLVVSVLVGGGWAAGEHPGLNGDKPRLSAGLISYDAERVVSGAMTIAGSDTMRPFLVKLAMEFRRYHPDIKIAVQGERNHGENTPQPLIMSLLDGFANSRRGDGKTSGHLGSNDVQLLAASQPLTEKEIKTFVARFGYAPTAIPIAHDAVAIYVHRSNPLEGLTLQQADAIFSKTRKRGADQELRAWGQLGIGATGEHAKIHTYGRDLRSSGTLPFFKQIVLLDGEFKADVRMQPGSASVVLAVSNDPAGIGYSGIGFQTSQVRVVPLAQGPQHPFVMPDQESVLSGRYPLSRPLYLYVNKTPDKAFDPKVLEFLRFANSREGQETIASGGVFPLTAERIAANLQLLGEALRSASLPVISPTN
jgi:phosphate transport system substrate-binding protein